MNLPLFGSPYFSVLDRFPDQVAWLFVWSHKDGYVTCGADLRVIGVEFSQDNIGVWSDFGTDVFASRASFISSRSLLQACLLSEHVLNAVVLLQNLTVSALHMEKTKEMYYEVDSIARILKW